MISLLIQRFMMDTVLCQKVEIEQYIKNGHVNKMNVYQTQVERFC